MRDMIRTIRKFLKSRAGNQKGFTLIDSVLSTTVLSVGILGSALAMQHATVTTLKGDMNTLATQLASEKIETIMADKEFLGFDYVGGENTYSTENFDGSFSGFTRTVTVTEVSTDDLETPQEGSGMKKIDVNVSWGDKSDEQVTLSTIVADYS